MNFSIPKILAFSSILIGIGSAFSGTFGTNYLQESSSPEYLNFDILELTNNNEAKDSKSICRIYEVKKNPDKYKVDEIIREISNKDEFLNSLDSSNKTFIEEVRSSCSEQSEHFKLGSYVYVHKLRNKWMYSKNLQGRDWSEFLTGKPIGR